MSVRHPKKSVPRPQRPRRSWRARLAAVALGLVAALVLLGLLEAFLRLVGYGNSTAFLIRHANGRGWTVNDRFHRRFYPSWEAGTSRPLFIPDHKESIRIVILGESAAMGTPNPAFGFARMLGLMLRAQYPGRDVSILNTSMRGIDS